MARNVEIKARIGDLSACAARIVSMSLADDGPVGIDQDDTFFTCAAGRLKLRAFADGTGELIFYQRPNHQGPKESFYVRAPVSAPDALRECLTLALGQVGRVLKRRQLFLAGRTRIHLDEVAQLGQFLELEVVLRDSEDPAAGMREARELMEKLEIRSEQLVEDAYVDLLSRR